MLSPNSNSKPTSPRYGYPPKQSFGKSNTGSNFHTSYKAPQAANGYRDNYTEASVYSTNYSKKEYEIQ